MEGPIKKTTALIRRLASYYNAINEFNISSDRITSKRLGKLTGYSSSQVRRDISAISEENIDFGQSGYGYPIRDLEALLKSALNIHSMRTMIVLGVGNLGKALMKNKDFYSKNFKIVAAFDRSEEKIGREISGISVRNINTLNRYLLDNNVDIAIMTIHHSKALQLARVCSERGVKAVWNFTAKEIPQLGNMIVENVRINDSLYTLNAILGEQDEDI